LDLALARATHQNGYMRLCLAALSALIFGNFGFAANLDPVNDYAIRQNMVNISRQLGVTCAHCHHMDNFKSGDLETFKTAAAHLKMVEELNAKRVHGLPKVDCYMCHQGTAHPHFAEPLKSEAKPAPKNPKTS
jgi:hypothetical protein